MNLGFDSFSRLIIRHGSEQYFRDESGRWTDGFEKSKDTGLMLAAASMGLVPHSFSLLSLDLYVVSL